MKNKIFFSIVWLTLIGAGLFLGLLFYWLAYPYNPVVFKDSVFPIVEKDIKAGHPLTYISRYCKYTKDGYSQISRTFVDGIIFVTPPTTSFRPIGCQSINVQIEVPFNLPPGEYHLHNIYTFQVNPIRTIVIEKDSELFIVTK